jgi:hypothetical protein
MHGKTTDKSYYRHSQPNRDREGREKRRTRRKKEKEEKNREQEIHPPSKFENILILL